MIKKLLFNLLLPKIYKFYLSINLKITEFVISEDEKCLCLAPHADDESIGCGGILSLYPKNFDVICLTDGRKGIKTLSADEAIKVRKEEFSTAMQFSRVKHFETFDIEDKHLIENYEKFKLIQPEEYDYIFIPNILDQHPDHKAVSLMLDRLLKEKSCKTDLKIVFYEVWSALPLPNAFADISSVYKQKEEMINSHKSQVKLKNYTKKAIALNSYRGLLRDKDFAEAFCIMDIKTFSKICKNC